MLPRSLWRPRRPSSAGIDAADSTADAPFTYDLAFWYNLDGRENDDVIAAEQEAVKYLRLSGSGALGDTASKLARLELRTSSAGSGDAPGNLGGVLLEDEQGGWIRRFTECQAHFTHWWPLLTGLAALVGDDRLPVSKTYQYLPLCTPLLFAVLVSSFSLCFFRSTTPPSQIRTRALDVLFGLLRDFGPGFSASFWALVFRGVLLPLFDDVRHVQNPAPAGTGAP